MDVSGLKLEQGVDEVEPFRECLADGTALAASMSLPLQGQHIGYDPVAVCESIERDTHRIRTSTKVILGLALVEESILLSCYRLSQQAHDLSFVHNKYADLVDAANFHTATTISTASTILSCSILVAAVVVMSLSANRRKRLTDKLVSANDVRAIGPILDAMERKPSLASAAAQRTLTTLLTRLKYSDRNLLNSDQRRRLDSILELRVENPLYKDIRRLFSPAQQLEIGYRVAILRAFEQIGDADAIPIVKRLAEQTPWGDGERQIQAAARDCLSALEIAAERHRSSATLLRAAEAKSDPAALLRAVSPTVDPEQLLRANTLSA